MAVRRWLASASEQRALLQRRDGWPGLLGEQLMPGTECATHGLYKSAGGEERETPAGPVSGSDGGGSSRTGVVCVCVLYEWRKKCMHMDMDERKRKKTLPASATKGPRATLAAGRMDGWMALQ